MLLKKINKALCLILSILFCSDITILFSSNINDTLEKAYLNSPILKAHRIKLESFNEEINQVLSENRPKVDIFGSAGSDRTTTVNTSNVESTTNNNPKSISIELSQNLYDSGRIKNKLDKTDTIILAERAVLFNEEQSVLLEAIEIYLDLLAALEINKLAANNLQVLNQHYKATQSRFEVGEATSTDLSLANARYLKAKSDKIRAAGNIEKEKSKYFSIVGEDPPSFLSFPSNKFKIPKNLKDIIKDTIQSDPEIISQGLRRKSSFLDISIAITNLLPKLDLNLSAQNAWAPNTFFDEYENYKMELSLKIPLYKGGYNYSNVRKKKNDAIYNSKLLDHIIKKSIKETEILWIEKKSLESQILSIQSTITANELALAGVKKETEVGARTVLDVLDAEQEVLEEKVEFIKVKRDLYYTNYSLLKKLGRLSPSELRLKIMAIDNNKNYNTVKKIWLGFDEK